MSSVLAPNAPSTASDSSPWDQEHDMDVHVSVEKVTKVLLCVVATLIITGTTANVITHKVLPTPEHKLAKVMNRFDINHEPSVPAWYSSCALLASSGLLALTGIANRRQKRPFSKHWLVLSVLFLGLSI